jgi:pre-mRNA-processing factor 17
MEQHVQQTDTFGGRQFIAPPPEMKNVEHTCYNPKRCIHTYKGHTKGVQVIRLFPKFGHLLLSGGLDNNVNNNNSNFRSKCGTSWDNVNVSGPTMAIQQPSGI